MARRSDGKRNCHACKQDKPLTEYESVNARKCDPCKAKPKLRLCRRCDQRLPLSEFIGKGLTCSACRELPRRPKMMRACMRCWEIKPATAFPWADGKTGKGLNRCRRRVCMACVEREQAERERRKRERRQSRVTWKRNGVMVRRCSKCRTVKPLESEFTVSKPKANGVDKWHYWCRACGRADAAKRRAGRVRTDELRAKEAVWARSWYARNKDRARKSARESRKRVMADPVRHARYLETTRMQYRLRKERMEGVPLDSIRAIKGHGPRIRDRMPDLPAKPLADVLNRMVQRQVMQGFEGPQESVCNLAGIASRNLNEWASGRRKKVEFHVAGRVLNNLGLMPWDVWDDPDVLAVWESEMAA